VSPQIAVITALYGDDYDTLKPVVPQSRPFTEWVLVTDREPDPELACGWRVIVDPKPDLSPRRAAKLPKFRPWEYTDAGVSVWLDSSFRVTSRWAVAQMTDYLADQIPEQDIAQFAHPFRDCLYAEAGTVLALGMDDKALVEQQTEACRRAGHPENWGLWATGVIVRKHTGAVKRLGNMWSDAVAMWSHRDQLSQPYALRLAGLRPVDLPGHYAGNEWLQYEPSVHHA
jgi:hypothetical protein